MHMHRFHSIALIISYEINIFFCVFIFWLKYVIFSKKRTFLMISKLKLIACVGINAVLDDRVNQNDNRIFTMKLKMNTKKTNRKPRANKKMIVLGLNMSCPLSICFFATTNIFFSPVCRDLQSANRIINTKSRPDVTLSIFHIFLLLPFYILYTYCTLWTNNPSISMAYWRSVEIFVFLCR